MTPPRPFLLDTLSVKSVDDNHLAVTVVLPADLVKPYCHFLESLAGFFLTVDRKARIEHAAQRQTEPRSPDPRIAYHARLVVMFDTYTADGLTRKGSRQRCGHAGRPRRVQP